MKNDANELVRSFVADKLDGDITRLAFFGGSKSLY